MLSFSTHKNIGTFSKLQFSSVQIAQLSEKPLFITICFYFHTYLTYFYFLPITEECSYHEGISCWHVVNSQQVLVNWVNEYLHLNIKWSTLMRPQVQLLQQRIRTVTWDIMTFNTSGIPFPSNLLLSPFMALLRSAWCTRDHSRSCVWASEKRKKTLRVHPFISRSWIRYFN